jgi:hypothetical protein
MKSRFIFKPERLQQALLKIHFFALITRREIPFKFMKLDKATPDSEAQASRIPHKMGLSA